jgi:hypothetical protein
VITIAALATLLIVSAICGGPRGPMDVGETATFTDEGATQSSGYEGAEPMVGMEKRGDRWFVTVYQGEQPSGGYAIQVQRAIHVGTGLRIRARFTTPASDAVTSAGKTSPAHTISFGFGADGITLYDQQDRLRLDWRRPY